MADSFHDMVDVPFVTKIKHAIKADASATPIVIAPEPLLNRLGTPHAEAELRTQFNSNPDVVITITGVQGTPDYTPGVHSILDAWSNARKPVLLMASSNNEATQAAIDSWPGWELLSQRLQQPVEKLKKAIIVNDGDIITDDSGKALAQIKNAITVSRELKPLLSVRADAPTINVQAPRIGEMKGLEPKLISF